MFAGVTAATLTLLGAAGMTVVLETPLTQALAVEALPRGAAAPIVRRSHHAHPGAAAPAGDLARGACDRWSASHSLAIEPDDSPRRPVAGPAAARVPGVIFADRTCQVDELVVSRDWVVARLTVRGEAAGDRQPLSAEPRSVVEVLHLTSGRIDEDWRLADERGR